MLYPVKVVDLELGQPLVTLAGLEGYMAVKGLVRLHGVPIGYVNVPITNGCCTVETIGHAILKEHSTKLINCLLEKQLALSSLPSQVKIEDLITLPSPLETFWQKQSSYPLVTVAVCTRDRPDDMKLCLAALSKLDYPNLDILVVDNAPTTDGTRNLIEGSYPQVRHVCEPRPGLDWARNRAILEAKGEIIAYTDDDVVVDPIWVKALAQVFVENPGVMAVTGLVVPYELETEAQVLFEEYGGFGRGFEQVWYQVKPDQPVPWHLLGAGQFGTGANMAYRRVIFDKIGYFDPALDVGTVTNGGGDLEMFFRVIKAGYPLVYEPTAVLRHRHRRDYAKLKTQVTNNGSLYAFWLSVAQSYPDQWGTCLYMAFWWMAYWNIRRLLISFLHVTQFPQELVWAEFWGGFKGMTTYPKACRRAKEITRQFGPQSSKPIPEKYRVASKRPAFSEKTVAVRQVELTQPLQALADLATYDEVRVFITWRNLPLGSVDISNQYQPVSKTRLCGAIVNKLGNRLLHPSSRLSSALQWAQVTAQLVARYAPTEPALEGLPISIPVSIALATYDRPDDLRNCLRCLTAQQTERSVEIIVIDNHPASGLTPPVVAEFPGIILIKESRQGLAYARNAGFAASTGEIVIATDDDVTLPPDWLEKLVAPFARPDVMIVTGHVLPLQLETASQQAFENYGGLGRGFDPFEVDGAWYDLFPHKPSPTWTLGATANAAFRASMFAHPEMGLMDEALGPGMPSGVGEDTYLFYKAIKAGYTIVYDPKAYVWHKHRPTQASLKRQLYGYSKGHVSYNLTTWLRDRDWRGLAQVLLGLPIAHLYRIKERLLGRSDYPIALIWLEIRGNLAGPWSLWMSRLRVRREGRSSPYIPPSQRTSQQGTREPALTTSPSTSSQQ